MLKSWPNKNIRSKILKLWIIFLQDNSIALLSDTVGPHSSKMKEDIKAAFQPVAVRVLRPVYQGIKADV